MDTSSTAIEGNTLTLGETAFVLREGLTISGKPLKDHEEVVGHAKAIDLIYDLVENQTSFTEKELFSLHKAGQIKAGQKLLSNQKALKPFFTFCEQAWGESLTIVEDMKHRQKSRKE